MENKVERKKNSSHQLFAKEIYQGYLDCDVWSTTESYRISKTYGRALKYIERASLIIRMKITRLNSVNTTVLVVFSIFLLYFTWVMLVRFLLHSVRLRDKNWKRLKTAIFVMREEQLILLAFLTINFVLVVIL